jgi:hypothetical protein
MACGFVFGYVGLVVGAVWLLRTPGAEKKECEVEQYTNCVPVCVTKNIVDCREKSGNGFTENPVFDFAMCMKNTCHQTCELMAWSNCYLPEADRLKWKE